MASSSSPKTNGVTGLIKNVKNRLTGSHETDLTTTMSHEEQRHLNAESGVDVDQFEKAFAQRHHHDVGRSYL